MLTWRTFLVDLFWLPSRAIGTIKVGVCLGAALEFSVAKHREASHACGQRALQVMADMRDVYASRIRARRADGAHKEARLLLADYYEVVERAASTLRE